jgi:hypothetical protein
LGHPGANASEAGVSDQIGSRKSASSWGFKNLDQLWMAQG